MTRNTVHRTIPMVASFPVLTGLTLPAIEHALNRVDLRTVPAGYQRERVKEARLAVAQAKAALVRLQSTLITTRKAS